MNSLFYLFHYASACGDGSVAANGIGYYRCGSSVDSPMSLASMMLILLSPLIIGFLISVLWVWIWKRSFQWRIILASTVILALLCVIAFNVVDDYQLKHDASNQSPGVTQEQWKTYRNDQYGFELKLPQEGFANFTTNVSSDDNSQAISFLIDASGTKWLSNQFNVFTIYATPVEWFNKNIAVDENNITYYKDEAGAGAGQSFGAYLGKNTENAFTWIKGQDCPGSKTDPSNYGSNTVQCKIYENAEQILATFKFNK